MYHQGGSGPESAPAGGGCLAEMYCYRSQWHRPVKVTLHPSGEVRLEVERSESTMAQPEGSVPRES
jgi:hypothetical protein